VLATLFRVLAWLAVIYAVEENVAMIIGAFLTSETPWSLIAAWLNPFIFDNWRFEGRLFAPALASHFLAGWLAARR
jgi:hypothetical protein